MEETEFDPEIEIKCEPDQFEDESSQSEELILPDDTSEDTQPCITCAQNVSSYQLKTHVQTHYTKTSFPCYLCPKVFNSLYRVERHELVHLKPIECVRCDMRFSSKYNLARHANSNNCIPGGLLAFKCEQCPRSFKRHCDLMVHVKNHLLLLENKEAKGEFDCGQCEEKFTGKDELSQHVLRAHFQTGDNANEKVRNLLKRTRIPKKMDFKSECDICGQKFNSGQQLKIHLEVHIGVRPHVCDRCDKTFKQKHHLDAHRKTHDADKPFSCPQCAKQFSRKDNLAKHMLRFHFHLMESSSSRELDDGGCEEESEEECTEDQDWVCPVCDEQFTLKKELQAHVITHYGNEYYPCALCTKVYVKCEELERHKLTHRNKKAEVCKCGDCGKEFNDRRALKTHIKIHSDSKPHACPHCPKRFLRSQHLKNHVMIHTGVKQFACDQCAMSFSRKDSLILHVQTSHGVADDESGVREIILYKCDHCDKKFKHKQSLTAHLKGLGTVVEKPHVCPICHSKWKRKYHLDLHMIIHTGEKPYPCLYCDLKFNRKDNRNKHMNKYHDHHIKKKMLSAVAVETAMENEQSSLSNPEFSNQA